MRLRFVKGHGTQNDFVLVPDATGALNLDEDLVRALCDRRAGIGADGVLRVVRADALEATGEVDAVDISATWFMDYWNADGSRAQMCGNGARVFARYLVEAGLAEPGMWPIATRGGLKTITVPSTGDIAVSMGPATLGGESAATIAGQTYPGQVVWVSNPHLVVVMSTPVGELDLSHPPTVDPAVFPHGANVEFINVTALDRIVMRVYERGIGETRSCGTGACAAAAVVARELLSGTGTITVEVPGGVLSVAVAESDCVLSGPAILTTEGEWLL